MDEKVVAAVAAWAEAYKEIEKYEDILEPLINKEYTLRKAVIAALYPDGQEKHEGTENHDVWPGWQLKAIVKITRSVDEAAYYAARDKFLEQKLPIEALVKLKPEISLKPYRELDENQKKLFDQVLIVKPGAPKIELIPVNPG